tara:strand:+ start:8441 stop:8662 length:222 start_codon:yes stop_codon:yes gene_type:complete
MTVEIRIESVRPVSGQPRWQAQVRKLLVDDLWGKWHPWNDTKKTRAEAFADAEQAKTYYDYTMGWEVIKNGYR